MPQFDFAHVFWPQFAWLAVVFAVLYFGVVRITLPRLGKVMTQREDQIGGDLAAARAAKDSAEALGESTRVALERSRTEARGAIAEAKVKATAASEVTMRAATARTDADVSAAEQRIAGAVSAATETLRNVAAENAAAIVERVTGKAATLEQARVAVDQVAAR